ncbi:MAG: glycosyltransferase WbpH [Methyloceanibacter sp.]|nr:MAG: glycosyltransferase WbpH [Methyloceanibacter sp.]
MRQIEVLRETGESVHAVGFGKDDLDGILKTFEQAPPGLKRRLATGTRLAAGRFGTARFAFWAAEIHRRMLKEVIQARPQIVHANDWETLPIAVAAKAETGCRVLYDTHEYAVGRRMDDRLWRLLFKPYISALERSNIRSADAVVTVSAGIAARLQSLYGLSETPLVIRNVSRYSKQPFRRVNVPIRVLYHGAFTPNRGLEPLILSVLRWNADRRLILRGVGAADYIAKLRQLASQTGCADRIEFAPPVPQSELVTRANDADVGIFCNIPDTVQTNYTLPNKLFEYVMAGLCVVVSPAEEMAELVRAHKLGCVLADATPDMIAEAVNALTPETIEMYKHNALAAARDLNWENEQRALLELYARLAAQK